MLATGEAFLSLFDDDPPAEVNKLEAKAPNSSAEERDAGSSPASLPEDDSNKISRAQPSSAEVKGDPATYRCADVFPQYIRSPDAKFF